MRCREKKGVALLLKQNLRLASTAIGWFYLDIKITCFFFVPYFKNVSVGLQDIFAVAERAVAELVSKDRSSIGYDFFYRVDLFEVDGELKVNEIESYDALLVTTRISYSLLDGRYG